MSTEKTATTSYSFYAVGFGHSDGNSLYDPKPEKGSLVRLVHDNGQDPRGNGPRMFRTASGTKDMGHPFDSAEDAFEFLKNYNEKGWGQAFGWSGFVIGSGHVIKRKVDVLTTITDVEVLRNS